MGDLPLQVVLFPAVALIATVAFLLHRRSSIARYDQQYANYRAGVLAQRMGMNLLEGDPEFNVFIRQANVDVLRGPKDGRPIQISLRAEGSPQGAPLEFRYHYRVEQDTGIATITWRTWFDCRLIARMRRPFPPFEVISRNAPLGPIAQTQALPASQTGNPQVDTTYLVTTQEPGMARLLGEILPAFAGFQNSGVHLVGDGQTIAFVMKQDKAPLLANALYYAEDMVAQLTNLARRVGG